jgi:hypothetical protein
MAENLVGMMAVSMVSKWDSQKAAMKVVHLDEMTADEKAWN